MDLYSLSFLLVGKMVQGTSENGFKMEFSAVNFFFFFSTTRHGRVYKYSLGLARVRERNSSEWKSRERKKKL